MSETRWLCICHYGHSRSVALARVLHGQKLPAVAAGWTSSGDALTTLSAWADIIALMTPDGLAKIPPEHRHKVHDFNIGPDAWSNPYHPELLAICRQKVADFHRDHPQNPGAPRP